jgi:hypothetical protein
VSDRRQELAKLSLDDLADAAAGPTPGSPLHGIHMAEFTRRQTLALQQAAEAQERAAEAQQEGARAAIDTARYTRRNAQYLLASVIVIALSALATFASNILLRQ